VVAAVLQNTSRRMRAPRGWAWFAGLTALGVEICLAFKALGGLDALVPAVLFYAYFLAHEIRDELFFYRVNGDAPAGDRDAAAVRALWTIPVVASAPVLAGILATAAFGLGGPKKLQAMLAGLDPAVRVALVAGAVVLAALAVVVTYRRLRRFAPDGFASLVRRHRPLMVVFALIYATLVVGVALTGRVYAIVAIHVCIWYVFTLRQLKQRPAPVPAPKPFTWAWVRATPAGFRTFHLAVFALVVGLAVWRTLAFGNAPEPQALAVLTSKEAFPYWTLLHVTWSWVPRG